MMDLSKVMLFKDMDSKDISSIVICLDGRVKRYKKGSNIITEGETSNTIGIVVDGIAQIIRSDIDGNNSVLLVLNMYDIFGEAYVCANSPFPLSVLAVEDCEVLHINIHKVIAPCEKSCEFHKILIKNMMFLLAQKNIQLNEKINIISKKTIRQRILYYLDFVQRNSMDSSRENITMVITIPFNRDELANYLSVDRSALSRELANMKKENIIDYHKNLFKLM